MLLRDCIVCSTHCVCVIQIFASETSRKVVWDDAAVSALLQQFEAPSEEVADKESTISRVLSNFKVHDLSDPFSRRNEHTHTHFG
jgi:hypothetical protein